MYNKEIHHSLLVKMRIKTNHHNLQIHIHRLRLTLPITLIQSLPQNLNLLPNLNPKHQLLQLGVLTTRAIHNLHPVIRRINRQHIHRRHNPLWLLVPRNGQQSRHKRLLYIRKAELVRDAGDSVTQLVREDDLLVVLELGLPEVAVGDAFMEVRVWEQVFPVEAGGAFLIKGLVTIV